MQGSRKDNQKKPTSTKVNRVDKKDVKKLPIPKVSAPVKKGTDHVKENILPLPSPKPKNEPTETPKIPFQKGPGPTPSGDVKEKDSGQDKVKHFPDEQEIYLDEWPSSSRKTVFPPKGRFYFPRFIEIVLQHCGFIWGKCFRFDDAFMFCTTLQLTMHFVIFALWMGDDGTPYNLYTASLLEIELEIFGFCKCTLLYIYLNYNVKSRPCSKLIIINYLSSWAYIGFQVYFAIQNGIEPLWKLGVIIVRIVVYLYTNFTIWTLGRQLLATAQYNYSLSIQNNRSITRLSAEYSESIPEIIFDTSDMSDYQFFRNLDHNPDSSVSKVTLRLVRLNPNT